MREDLSPPHLSPQYPSEVLLMSFCINSSSVQFQKFSKIFILSVTSHPHRKGKIPGFIKKGKYDFAKRGGFPFYEKYRTVVQAFNNIKLMFDRIIYLTMFKLLFWYFHNLNLFFMIFSLVREKYLTFDPCTYLRPCECEHCKCTHL